jgi:hypothetical protein
MREIGLQKPGGLVVLLDRAAAGKRGGAAFDGGGVGLDRGDPVEVQRHAGVPGMGDLRQKARLGWRKRVHRASAE